LNIKGSSYWVVGDYESALEHYQIAARTCNAISDLVGLSQAYSNIGEVHKKLGDYRKAVRFLKISLEWDKKSNVNYSITLYNIGEAYFEREDFDEAISYFEQALNRSIVEHDIRATAYSYNGLGKLQQEQGNSDKALFYFREAEALWEETGEIRSLIQIYQSFSDTYLALGDLKMASSYIGKATVLAESVRAADLQVENYERQAELYLANGDYKQSVEYLKRRSALTDSLYDVNRSEQIARLQVSSETDAQLIENEQLKAARALQDARLKAQSFLIIAISGGLLVSGLLAIVFFRQRKKIIVVNSLLRDKTAEINKQKEEIECQALKMKDLNDELQNLNKSLETRIEERTHQLWWKNQKLADYAHTNSHKLRAPVASILGLIQLMSRIELPADDKILLEKLHVCAMDLDKITRDINQNLEQDPELGDALSIDHRSVNGRRN
jgi:tetratricopeptide (TPR) repeat protein